MAKQFASNQLVSVILPVYNGEKFLSGAINSILTQTHSCLELIIINDGSTDNTEKIIKSFNDSRIRYFKNPRNRRLPYTLNLGVRLSKGKYIAIMDSDDISVSRRLARQVSFLEKHPEIVLCGGAYKVYGSNVIRWYNPEPEFIKCGLLFRTMFANPTVMWHRNKVFRAGFRYELEDEWSMDYGFFAKIADRFLCSNLNDVLLIKRVSPAGVSSKNSLAIQKTDIEIKKKLLSKIGIVPTAEELLFHLQLGRGNIDSTEGNIRMADRWLSKLRVANGLTRYYDQKYFNWIIGDYWLNVFIRPGSKKIEDLKRFLSSTNLSYRTLISKKFAIFFLGCLLHKR